MSLAVFGAVLPVVFLGELPDKTMFASLLLASRGRPVAVWVGAAAAFTVHVAIAVTAGRALAYAPRRAVDVVVAVLFLAGAVWAARDTAEHEEEVGERRAGATGERRAGATGERRAVLTAFGVIFIAEWGDLTQILIANLAAHYRDPLAVGLASLVALWLAAGLAVAGSRLLRRLSTTFVRRVTAVVLVVLAGFAAAAAAGA